MMIKVIGPGSEKPRMIPCPQGKSILEALQGGGIICFCSLRWQRTM